MIRKLLDALKLYKFGIFGFLAKKVFSNILEYNKMYLYQAILTADIPAPTDRSNVTIECINSVEDPKFKQFRARFPANEFVHRLQGGKQACYVVFKGKDAVGYSWVCFNEHHLKEVNYTFPLNDQELFIYSCFVLKDHRGEGLYPLMLRAILYEYSRKMKFHKVYISVLSYNSGSIKGIEKTSFLYFKTLRYLRFLGFRKWWPSYLKDKARSRQSKSQDALTIKDQ